MPRVRDSQESEAEVGVERRMGGANPRRGVLAGKRAVRDARWGRQDRVAATGAGLPTGVACLLLLVLLVFGMALPVAGRDKDKLPYGEGLIVNIPLPESEVEKIVVEVAQNGVIRGTKEYNKDEFISGAKQAPSTHAFATWEEGGKVFYKVREQAIDPRNFKDSGDVGTLAVRYVVLAQGDKNTVLRIDAVFVEDFRHTVHQSNGSVESSEYKDIQEHIEAVEVMKKQNDEALRERQEQLARKQNLATGNGQPVGNGDNFEAFPSTSRSAPPPTTSVRSEHQGMPQAMESEANSSFQPTPVQAEGQALSGQTLPNQGFPSQDGPGATAPWQAPAGQSLEEHVKYLRQQVERLVKAPGAPLKSAPFHTASTLETLSAGTEVLILISSPYWYGIETHEGQHGWIMRDQLEAP